MILRPVAGGRGFAPRATTWVVWLRFARRSGYVQETTTAQWAMVIATGVNERTGAAVGQATHLRILGQTSVREEEIMGSRSKNSPLNRQSRAEHLDKLLDEALEQTFPASDPVAIDFERSGDSSGCCRARPKRSDETAISREDAGRGKCCSRGSKDLHVERSSMPP
jgi:hypothetical protein